MRIPSRQDVYGHYVVRAALEVQAARLYTENATAEEREEQMVLAVRIDHLRTSPEPNSTPLSSLHETLHRRIAEYARCRALLEAIERAHALAACWLCQAHAKPQGPGYRRHQELMEALNQGSADDAAGAMRSHIDHSLNEILPFLEPYFKLKKAQGRTFYRGERGLARLSQVLN